jgi:hypothetical protein
MDFSSTNAPCPGRSLSGDRPDEEALSPLMAHSATLVIKN